MLALLKLHMTDKQLILHDVNKNNCKSPKQKYKAIIDVSFVGVLSKALPYKKLMFPSKASHFQSPSGWLGSASRLSRLGFPLRTQMRERQLAPTVVNFNSTMDACAKGGSPQLLGGEKNSPPPKSPKKKDKMGPFQTDISSSNH